MADERSIVYRPFFSVFPGDQIISSAEQMDSSLYSLKSWKIRNQIIELQPTFTNSKTRLQRKSSILDKATLHLNGMKTIAAVKLAFSTSKQGAKFVKK
jgi:hypothetical protein